MDALHQQTKRHVRSVPPSPPTPPTPPSQPTDILCAGSEADKEKLKKTWEAIGGLDEKICLIESNKKAKSILIRRDIPEV